MAGRRPLAGGWPVAGRRLGRKDVRGLRRLLDPAADPVGQGLVHAPLGVAEPGDDPQLLGVAGRLVELVGVVDREVDVLIPMDDQEGCRRDLGRRLGRGYRHGIPPVRAHPRLEPGAGDQAAGAALDRPVDPAHRLGAAVVPAPGPAHRDRRVQAADQARVAHHDRGAHRETDRGDPPVAQLPCVGHRHVQVVDLPVAYGGQPAGPAVPAEVEGDHAPRLVQPLGHFPDERPRPRQREAVRHDDRQLAAARQVDGVDRHTVGGHQGLRLQHGCAHLPILRDRMR